MRDRRVALWLVIGLMVGIVAAPRVASAVGSLVTIQGGNGSTKANVTDGKQLQVAEAAPSSFHEYSASSADANCHVVATIPSNKGFVIRSVSLDVVTPSTGGFEAATLTPNGSCGGNDIYAIGTHTRASHAVSVDPGFAIAPGGHVSLKSLTSCVVAVHIWGYFVPAADVPSTTAVN